jgi:hypothetical protein
LFLLLSISLGGRNVLLLSISLGGRNVLLLCISLGGRNVLLLSISLGGRNVLLLSISLGVESYRRNIFGSHIDGREGDNSIILKIMQKKIIL